MNKSGNGCQCCQRRVALSYPHCAAYLLRDNDAPEVVDPSDNSGCFHVQNILSRGGGRIAHSGSRPPQRFSALAEGGSRPLCPHDGRLPHGGVRGYYLKKRQELYRVRIFFQEWFRILLIRLSDAEFLYKKRSPQRAHQRSPLRRSFFTVGERQSPGQPCPARVIRPRGSIPPRWSMQAT